MKRSRNLPVLLLLALLAACERDTPSGPAAAPVPSAALRVSGSGVFAYVTHFLTDSVSVVETSTNTVTARIGVGDGPHGVAITPSGSFAYVVNAGSGPGFGTVSVIRMSDNAVTATVPVGSVPTRVAITPKGPRVCDEHLCRHRIGDRDIRTLCRGNVCRRRIRRRGAFGKEAEVVTHV